jgi:predicted nucleotidyltransferase
VAHCVSYLNGAKRLLNLLKANSSFCVSGGSWMKAREGDLIKTKSNVLFDVKGLVHPREKIIAFPRFIPSPQGTRQGKEGKYGKVYSLGDRFKYLQENHPDLIVFDPVFGETLCEVPITQIAEHYKPEEKLAFIRPSKHLNPLETKALRLAETLQKEANIPWGSLGISGSIMAGLATEKSDIDPIIYGISSCRKAYIALEKLLEVEDSGFKPYSLQELQELFDFRSKDTQMSFEDFVNVESRKAFQGKFMGSDYFIRFVKDWNEVSEHYGDLWFKNSGYAKITANIDDSTDSLFTPCNYRIADVRVVEGPKLQPIKEIVSFRGRFCKQATNGEAVEVQGKVELVTNKKSGAEYYRLILGNKPSDYMVLSHT